MSGTTVLVIAVPAFLLLVAILLVGAARRRDTDVAIGSLSRETRKRDRSQVTASADGEQPLTGRDVERRAEIERHEPSRELARVEAAPPAPWTPPDDETVGVSRRQFLNRSIVNAMAFGIGAFSLSSIAFLWPQGTSGFGSKIRIGSADEVRAKVREGNGFAYYPEGRMWVTQYPSEALDKAREVYTAELAGMEAGFVALYQKCVHLGCRVPSCETSQWFECPCHGSQYNQVGEKKGGPAPRGLDRFPIDPSGGALTVDTGIIIQGPPIGTNTTGQEAEGPHCIGSVEGH